MQTTKYKDQNPSKGIVFYTDNRLKLSIARLVQNNLRKISQEKNIPIVSASLKPMRHFGKNIYFPHLKPGYFAYFKQILGALEGSSADIIFMCEHDVLYHPSHFDFTPQDKDIFYYNHNWWRVRTADGFVGHWDGNQVSGSCVYRELLLKFYRRQFAYVEKYPYRNHPDLGPDEKDKKLARAWKSQYPNVDLRHGHNLSKNKWCLDDFYDLKFARTFIAGYYDIPGWEKTSDLIKKF